ncbi:hypothetical protein PLIIFM63780_006828 [Purpureocillium lilacinum]|uniref:Acetyltransferase (GNAT) family domain-containing protein n=1 Tax=Purpureocillium lilacinum TaxID=33203 RepID=A0A179FX39_PURLI|nr:acetyltransferase (GNAT) family domain-containing protein [Purpureocillium lilacinum]GJN72764.1 hypothetical protein PLICBS_006839 [Purpureocillium lilacinum]GJN83280.1 hypothetical protein PLIIFM63780_006828 [Purpureocillium lilacinum]
MAKTSPNVFHIRNAGLWPHDADFMIAAFDSTIPHLAAGGNAGQWGVEPFSRKDGFIQETHDDVRLSEEYRLTGKGDPVRTFIAEVRVDDGNSTSSNSNGNDDGGDGKVNVNVNGNDNGIGNADGDHDNEGSNSGQQSDGVAGHPLPLRTSPSPSGATFLPVGLITIRDGAFSRHVSSNAQLRPYTQLAKAEHARATSGGSSSGSDSGSHSGSGSGSNRGSSSGRGSGSSSGSRGGGGGFIYVDVVVTDFRTGKRRAGAGAALLQAAKEYARDRGRRSVYIDCWTGGTGKLVPYYQRLGFKPIQDFGVKRKDATVWTGKFLRYDLPEP